MQIVDDMDRGINHKLAVAMPPRSGKSELMSIHFPLWMLRRSPSTKIMLASYDPALSTSWARTIRRMIEEQPELGVAITPDGGATPAWETVEGGGVYATSTKGSLTGRGANCLHDSTIVESEYGPLPVSEAVRRRITRTLAYDHIACRAVWADVEATNTNYRSGLVEITTEAGRVLRCTSDHLVYVGGEYRTAESLRSGDTLLAVPGFDEVRPVSRVIRDQGGRDSESHIPRPAAVPQPAVFIGGTAGDSDTRAVSLRESDQGGVSVLLQRVPEPLPAIDQDLAGSCLRTMRGGVSCAVQPQTVLLEKLRGYGSLDSDAGQGEQPPPVGQLSYRPFSGDAPGGIGSGQVLSGLLDSGIVSGPSHRRRPGEQCHRESDSRLPGVPHNAPQIQGDTVAEVRHVGSAEMPFYDLQVAGHNNFFADGLLVHNCLIIDDPIKDFVEAHSARARQALWQWWLSVAQTRLEPPFFVGLVQTRWHVQDFLGSMFDPEQEGDPEEWEQIRLPAISEGQGDRLGREVGVPLLSPLLNETEDEAKYRWKITKRNVGTAAFSAMYQQRPAPAKGAIFDSAWWRYWTTDRSKATEDGQVVYLDPYDLSHGTWLDSWDFRFKATANAGDYVVGQRWVREAANRYLIAQRRGRWSFTQTIEQLDLWATTDDDAVSPCGHLVHSRLVEEKANGSAIIDVLKDRISGLKPVNPTTSKEARSRAVTPEIESGNVYLPHPSDPGNGWVTDLLGELRNFPHDAFDDMCDALTQALTGLRVVGRGSVSVPGALRDSPAIAGRMPRRSVGQVAATDGRRRGISR